MNAMPAEIRPEEAIATGPRQWLWSYFTGERASRLIPEPPPASASDRS
jgi:hypothetical protein